MRIARQIIEHYKKRKITGEDIYNTLSFHVWKTGLEIIKELESEGLRTGVLRANMYVRFFEWEEEGLIKSRERPLTEKQLLRGLTLPQREYLRVSTGTPVKLFKRKEVIIEELVPARTCSNLDYSTPLTITLSPTLEITAIDKLKRFSNIV